MWADTQRALSIWTLSKHHGKLEQGLLSREGLRLCWLWEDGAGDQLLEHRPADRLWRGQEELASWLTEGVRRWRPDAVAAAADKGARGALCRGGHQALQPLELGASQGQLGNLAPPGWLS